MKVSEAIATRKTIRAFLSDPVAADTVRDILVRASRAPSGGNLQPWHVYVLMDAARDELVRRVAEVRAGQPMGDAPEYHIYPPELSEPYKTRRFRVGEMMYATMGIPREDKASRLEFFGGNWKFFGAPVGLVFTIDRQMQQGQWADLGMFMQNVMLLARETGLHTCPQEAWALFHKTDPRLPVGAAERDDLLRHGDRLCRRNRAGEPAGFRTRAVRRIRHHARTCVRTLRWGISEIEPPRR